MCKIQTIREHSSWTFEIGVIPKPIFFSNKQYCLEVSQLSDETHQVKSNYFIGVDWVVQNERAIYVEPKLNKESFNTDYLKMLFSALQHSDIAQRYTKGVFEIKFDEPYIEIEQKQDLLTPLLVVQFLQVVKAIVRKGLKKSYYKVENNLNSRVKGKIIVSKTLKNNVLKNKLTHTVCQYEEFGYNGLENRLLKKAMLFVQRYLPMMKIKSSEVFTQEAFNYILPAFTNVDDDIDLNAMKHTKTNAFYKEYEEGLRLARLILKRFGYNITTIDKQGKVKVPPFWIDMSKLFELYVLGLLKEKFSSGVEFQVKGKYGWADYLVKFGDKRLIVDAKYKPKYLSEYEADDIRQLSGYARDKGILSELGVSFDKIVDCLIIYPDQTADEKLKDEWTEIDSFTQFYKTAVKLPVIQS